MWQIKNNGIEASDVNFVYTATEAGNLTLSVGGAVMGPVEITYSVNDGAANAFELNSEIVVTVAAGDKVVINVVASGYATIAASFAVPPTEIAGQIQNLGANEFTLTENSYVLIPLHPTKALHDEVKEKTKDSRSNEIKTDDFNKKQVVVGSRSHSVPTSQRADKTSGTHTSTGSIIGHLEP